MKQAILALALSLVVAPVARAADAAALLTQGKLAADTGDRSAAAAAFEAVAGDLTAPASLRWEALVRLGLVRRDGGDEKGAVLAFARVLQDYRQDKDAVAQLILALGGVVPGAERWEGIWQKVVVVIDPSQTSLSSVRIEWPGVPAYRRGPVAAKTRREGTKELIPGWEEDKRAATGPRQSKGPAPISLHFQDGNLYDMFRLFADISGLNVVVRPGVGGYATLQFKDLPWDEALYRILAPNGLAYVLVGPVLEIGPPDELPPFREFVGKPTEVDFQHVDLRDALARVAKAGGRSVSVSPGVAGRVTLKLSGVPWDQAFDLVARLNGLTWKDDGKTIHVELPARAH
jgi:hypothetical protein